MKNLTSGRAIKVSAFSAAWICLGLYGCIAAPVEGDNDSEVPMTGGVGGASAGSGGAGAGAPPTAGIGGSVMSVGGMAGTAPGTGGAPTAGTGGAPLAAGGAPIAGTGATPAVGGTSAGTAGTPATGGSAGDAAGSGGTTAGAGGTVTAGSGGSGGGNSDPLCKSIKSDAVCTAEAVNCPGLACGLADSGTRDCLCATTWMCSSCDFTGSPFAMAPTAPVACTTQADKAPCTTVGELCTGAADGEACACYTDDEGVNMWDCDDPPWE